MNTADLSVQVVVGAAVQAGCGPTPISPAILTEKC
jgi:hypothetical protein